MSARSFANFGLLRPLQKAFNFEVDLPAIPWPVIGGLSLVTWCVSHASRNPSLDWFEFKQWMGEYLDQSSSFGGRSPCGCLKPKLAWLPACAPKRILLTLDYWLFMCNRFLETVSGGVRTYVSWNLSFLRPDSGSRCCTENSKFQTCITVCEPCICDRLGTVRSRGRWPKEGESRGAHQCDRRDSTD